MSPEPFIPRQRQRGLGLVAAIFVITVMALITVGLSALVVTGQQGYGQQLLSTRASLAAESGAQLAVNRLLPPGRGNGDCAEVETAPALPAAGFRGCSVTVSCSAIHLAESATTYYTLKSEGRCGSDADQAVRRLSVRIQQPD